MNEEIKKEKLEVCCHIKFCKSMGFDIAKMFTSKKNDLEKLERECPPSKEYHEFMKWEIQQYKDAI